MLKYNQLYAHYYCLLLASGLSQNGRDNEGMLGFLLNDIIKEKKRGEKLRCSYCKKNGATIGCEKKSCKKSFHLPCGLRNKSMHQFFGRFHSYCIKHRPKQEITGNTDMNEMCPTCYSSVQFDSGIDVLDTPCCHKLFHRSCLEKQALSAGYFFKCPLCNNAKEFKQEMLDFGIYVPKQDASWETENNAFGELYRRHSKCDVEICVCRNGREYSDDDSRSWKIMLCNTCGSQGAHISCALITGHNAIWVCNDCKELEQRAKKRNKRPVEISIESDDGYDIEMIEHINTPSSSTSLNTITSNAINRRLNRRFDRTNSQRTRTRLSNNSDQKIDIENQTIKRLRTNQSETPAKKDIGIQCLLVEDKDLIDCDPIDHYSDKNLAENERIIWPKNRFKDVIEMDSSDDDDECLILN